MAARDAMTHAVRRAVCCVKQDTTVKVAKDVSRHLCQQVLILLLHIAEFLTGA